MKIEYITNLIILGVECPKNSKIDLDSCALDNFDKNIVFYKGSLSFKDPCFTLRITSNSYVTVLVRAEFVKILANIEEFILDVLKPFLKYWADPLSSLNVFIKNIQITFSIILRQISFRALCRHLVKYYTCKYNFFVKESNSYESQWITLDTLTEAHHFSTIRLYRSSSRAVFTFSHTLRGNCLVKDFSLFKEFCEDIKSTSSCIDISQSC